MKVSYFLFLSDMVWNYLLDCLDDFSVGESEVLKSPTGSM